MPCAFYGDFSMRMYWVPTSANPRIYWALAIRAFSQKKASHCEVGGFRRDQWWSLCIGNAAVGQKCFLRWIETSTLELHVLFAAIGESHLRFLRNPGPRSVAWRVCASYQWGERCSQLMLPHLYSNNRCLSVVQHVTKLRVILSCVASAYRSVFDSCGAWLESFLRHNKNPRRLPRPIARPPFGGFLISITPQIHLLRILVDNLWSITTLSTVSCQKPICRASNEVNYTYGGKSFWTPHWRYLYESPTTYSR